jgi:hypothetical protein
MRQGDILFRVKRQSPTQVSELWTVIVTADCDIAQNKMRERFTCLDIIRIEDWLEGYWAPEQLRRLVERQGRIACQSLNGIISRSGASLSQIDIPSLCVWLREQTANEIMLRVCLPQNPLDTKTMTILRALRICLVCHDSYSNMRRLRQAWALLGREEKSQRAIIQEAFESDRGFPDFMLIPDLPGVSGYGFIVALRAISTLPSSDVFKTNADAHINGKPDAYYRIGRFSDNLRFSVAQKLAFLFSRIGMSLQFETACAAVTELVIETMYRSSQEEE